MVVFKVLFLLAAVHVVYPKPLLFNEMKVKKNVEFSIKPLLKPVTFIKKWKPLGHVKIAHKIGKRSPTPGEDGPPLHAQPSPAPLLKIDLEKSLELHPADSTVHKDENLIKKPPSPVGSPPIHEEIHIEHLIPKPAAAEQVAQIELGPASVLPPENHRRNMPPHDRLPPVSPLPPPHADHEDNLRESIEIGEFPPLGPLVPVTVRSEQHLLVEPKPIVTPIPIIASEGVLHGFSKPPSLIIQGHPPPPPPPRLPKFTPSLPKNENDGTLDSFFGPPTVERLEKPEPPVSPNFFTGQGSFPVPKVASLPPAGIQEKPHREAPPKPETPENNRVSLFTDISRVDEISAYIKAIDALPLVKPPLEEIIPGNSLEPLGPKSTVDAKAEPSAFARGSRLALYFGNILLQMMSQAIGSARTAIGQYSMPSMI